MKSLATKILESYKDWSVNPDWEYSPNASWVWVHLDSNTIGFLSEKELAKFAEDFDDDSVEKECKELKPGEFTIPDGSNLYIRIK